MNVVLDTWEMTLRDMRRLLRQPWFVAVTLVQPVIWLLLFGSLFQDVVKIPGFQGSDYDQFLAPGIVVMVALFSSGWSGMPLIEEMERGVVDRFLITPIRRGPLIAGRLLQGAISVAIQSLIIVALALVTGAAFPGGVAGVAVLIVLSCVLGFAFGALSNALALTLRSEESVIGVNTFLMLPLTFLSSAFMQQSLVPGWIREVARFNPVDWAVEAGREAVSAGTDWGFVAVRAALLVAFAAVACWLATRAFRSYQRSV